MLNTQSVGNTRGGGDGYRDGDGDDDLRGPGASPTWVHPPRPPSGLGILSRHNITIAATTFMICMVNVVVFVICIFVSAVVVIVIVVAEPPSPSSSLSPMSSSPSPWSSRARVGRVGATLNHKAAVTSSFWSTLEVSLMSAPSSSYSSA